MLGFRGEEAAGRHRTEAVESSLHQAELDPLCQPGVTLYALEAEGEGVGTGAVMGAWGLPSASYEELSCQLLGCLFVFLNFFLNKLLCSAETAV